MVISKPHAMTLVSLLLVTSLTRPLCSEIIWDNRGERGWICGALSSERNTRVPASWAADDFLLIPGGTIEIISILIEARPYDAHVVSADYLILDHTFRVVTGEDDVNPELELIQLCGFAQPGLFRVTIDVAPIELPAGHYYCAVRLVGTGPDCECQFFAEITDGGICGETEGYWQSDFFGFPDWTPNSEIFENAYDLSFWLTGELSQPDCDSINKVRARTDCERQKVIARVRANLPDGTQLGLTLDGRRPQSVTLDDRGRAKTHWTNATGGEVCVGGCEEPCATAPDCG